MRCDAIARQLRGVAKGGGKEGGIRDLRSVMTCAVIVAVWRVPVGDGGRTGVSIGAGHMQGAVAGGGVDGCEQEVVRRHLIFLRAGIDGGLELG